MLTRRSILSEFQTLPPSPHCTISFSPSNMHTKDNLPAQDTSTPDSTSERSVALQSFASESN